MKMGKVGKYNNRENTLMLRCLHFSKEMDTSKNSPSPKHAR